MEENNRVWILIARVLSNEASPEDHAELAHLLKTDDELRQQYRSLKKLWQVKNNSSENSVPLYLGNSPRLRRILDKGSRQRASPDGDEADPPVKPRLHIYVILKYAAVITLASACAWFFISKSMPVKNPVTIKEQVLAVKNGNMTKIILPDGTQVWLNAGSKLVYPEHFDGSTRTVKLLGEGFFDVVKDKHHPFIVNTAFLSLKVLGTAFNVRAYANDQTSEASLIRGKIEVTLTRNPDKKIILKPSEKLTIKNSYSDSKIEQKELNSQSEKIALISLSNIHQSVLDTLPSEALWIENRLVFDDETFENIAHKIERRYNVSVIFKNNEVRRETFTGKFKDESVYKVLRSLQTIENFHFNIKNNQIIVY